MGYNIRVDHSEFKSTAKSIRNYTSKMNSKMKNADTTVNTMLSKWQGKDANAFKVKWNGINTGDSEYMKTKKSLENYAKFLEGAGSKYRDTQANAINRARRLPRW